MEDVVSIAGSDVCPVRAYCKERKETNSFFEQM